MHLFMTLLLGCSFSAKETQTAAPMLDFVHESHDGHHGAPQLWRFDGTAAAWEHGVEGGIFPTEPDPLGLATLVIQVLDDDKGHRESLWLLTDKGFPKQLTQASSRVRQPSFSRDGQWIYFASGEWGGLSQLGRVKRSGSAVQRLTEHDAADFDPVVGRGGRVAFVSTREAKNAEIFVMNDDGSGVTRLTHSQAEDGYPRWSPSGDHIAWTRRDGHEKQAWIMTRDGQHPKRIRKSPPATDYDVELLFSPDGEHIAITVERTGKDRLVDIVNLKTGETTLRLDGEGPDEHPTFSPDGKYVVFSSSRNGSADLWLASIDGKQLTQLTDDPGAEWLPRWRHQP